MQQSRDGTQRIEYRRLIGRLALVTHWTPDQIRDMDVADVDVVLQELTGKRRMTDQEIDKELQRWRLNLSRSSSAQTPAS